MSKHPAFKILKDKFTQKLKYSHCLLAPMPMESRGEVLQSTKQCWLNKSFKICLGCLSFLGLEITLEGAILCFFFFLPFFKSLNQISIYIRCFRESCNTVLLWNFRNVLWTMILETTFQGEKGWVDNDWIFNFGWTYPLHFNLKAFMQYGLFQNSGNIWLSYNY